jgi:hypothetical protein
VIKRHKHANRGVVVFVDLSSEECSLGEWQGRLNDGDPCRHLLEIHDDISRSRMNTSAIVGYYWSRHHPPVDLLPYIKYGGSP